ncbi:hypothetical protein FM102_13900 [Corynebacterium glutamicum]|nr:hypothetical protein FM102_13900 [Corynebacterium glutamicum]
MLDRSIELLYRSGLISAGNPHILERSVDKRAAKLFRSRPLSF